jgi:WD40 repeat protein
MGVTRTAARRFAVALVAVLLFAGWQVGFAFLLRARPRATIPPTNQFWNVSFSPDSTLPATWTEHGSVHVRDTIGNIRFSVADGWDRIETVIFSPDSTMLAAGQRGGDLKVWDTASGKEVWCHRPVPKDGHWVYFTFTPKCNLLVLQDYGEPLQTDHVHFFDLTSGQQIGMLKVGLGESWFSPDGSELTAWYTQPHDPNVKVQRWRYGDGPPFIHLVSEHRLPVHRAAYSADGQLLATVLLPDDDGGSVNIEVRDSKSLRLLTSFAIPSRGRNVQGVEFTPERTLAVRAISEDTPTQLWDVSG